ncbi:MAG: hypothetical protein EON58_02350 [Alphaproteobacteria bacterium]|nr:MAG: hypothetical protein EON58_02350 [Alphaproteobacteria bacterium]
MKTEFELWERLPNDRLLGRKLFLLYRSVAAASQECEQNQYTSGLENTHLITPRAMTVAARGQELNWATKVACSRYILFAAPDQPDLTIEEFERLVPLLQAPV